MDDKSSNYGQNLLSHAQKDEESHDPEAKSLLSTDKVQWYMDGRKYSVRELEADRSVLLLGAIASVPAAFLLLFHTIRPGVDSARVVAMLVYCFGFIFMFNASLCFHRHANSERLAPILLFLDKMGINCMIAGSYTPVCVYCACYSLLAIEWGLVVFGVVWEIIFFQRNMTEFPWKAVVDILRFICAGWMVLLFIPNVVPYLSPWSCYITLAHGLLYTCATFFLQYRRLEFHFCIWHSLVLVAAIMFFSVVYTELAQGGHFESAAVQPAVQFSGASHHPN